MKNTGWGGGEGEGLTEGGGLINFPPLKKGGLNRGFKGNCKIFVSADS